MGDVHNINDEGQRLPLLHKKRRTVHSSRSRHKNTAHTYRHSSLGNSRAKAHGKRAETQKDAAIDHSKLPAIVVAKLLFFVRSFQFTPILLAKIGVGRICNTPETSRYLAFLYYTRPGSTALEFGKLNLDANEIRLTSISKNNAMKNLFEACYREKAEKIKYSVISRAADTYIARGLFVNNYDNTDLFRTEHVISPAP